MKKTLLKSLSAVALAAGVFVTTFTMPTTAKAETSVEIYRLYNSVNGEHLYTTDANEKNVLSAMADWTYEGIGWYASSTGTPVYRLYNDALGNHLYTTDTNEVNVLTTTDSHWSVDNNGQPLFYSGGSVPVYRVYNEGLKGMHHLTTDKNEYDTLPSYGWNQEGVALYAVSLGIPAASSDTPSSSETPKEETKPEANNCPYELYTMTYREINGVTYYGFYYPDDDSELFDVSKWEECCVKEGNQDIVVWPYDTVISKKVGKYDDIGKVFFDGARVK